jgi:hypothetical protein
VHYPSDAERTDSLHRLGEKLFVWVSRDHDNVVIRDPLLGWLICQHSRGIVLHSKLFGEDDEATDETELEKAKADGEDGTPCPLDRHLYMRLTQALPR